MSKSGIRLDDDVYDWLFDNRNIKEKTISAVVRRLIPDDKINKNRR